MVSMRKQALSHVFGQPARKKGMVLILVLLIFSLASIISTELSYQSHREIRRTANILHNNEAYLFARGGEVYAVQKLLMDFTYDQQSGLKADYLSEAWSVSSEAFDLDMADSSNAVSTGTGQFVNEDFAKGERSAFQDIGEMSIIIEDLQARFNANNVQYNAKGHFSGVQQFENVLNAVLRNGVQQAGDNRFEDGSNVYQLDDDNEQTLLDDTAYQEQTVYLEIPPADLSRALKDWIDLDSESTMAMGSEDDFYEQLKPPYRAANREVADVSELKAVNGFSQNDFQMYKLLMPERFPLESMNTDSEGSDDELDRQDELIETGGDVQGYGQYDQYGNLVPLQTAVDAYWGGVKQYLSALPFPSKINVNTASSEVLQALFTPEQADLIVSGRQGSPYQNVEDIFLNLQNIKKEQHGNYTPYLSVKSEYFLATIIAKVGDTQFTLRSKLFRDPKGQVRVIAREFSH